MQKSKNKSLGLRFKEARERKKLTQEAVASQADMTETYYAMTERAETNPSWNKLEKLAKVLGLKLSIEDK